MNSFSPKKLRTLREHQNLTQEALAEQCAVDTTTISGWEKGKWEPSLQSAVCLSRALNVTVEDLCDIKKELDFTSITINRIVYLLKGMSQKEQEFIFEIAKNLKELHTL